jgi:predicted aspartyl protease
MGRVLTTITVTNLIDAGMADNGLLDPAQIRVAVLTDVLVDTGATHLCLPSDVISVLGLRLLREAPIMTALGPGTTRLFTGLLLEVEGRSGSFDCLELPERSSVLLGLLPREGLGLEPDLANQRLRLLPNSGPDNYLMVL